MEWAGKILRSVVHRFFLKSSLCPSQGQWEQCPLAPSLHPEGGRGELINSWRAGSSLLPFLYSYSRICMKRHLQLPPYYVPELPHFTLSHARFLLKIL